MKTLLLTALIALLPQLASADPRVCIYGDISHHEKFYFTVREGQNVYKNNVRLVDEWNCFEKPIHDGLDLVVESESVEDPLVNRVKRCSFHTIADRIQIIVRSRPLLGVSCTWEGGNGRLRTENTNMPPTPRGQFHRLRGRVEMDIGHPIDSAVIRVVALDGHTIKTFTSGRGEFDTDVNQPLEPGTRVEAIGGTVDGKPVRGMLQAYVWSWSNDWVELNPITSIMAEYVKIVGPSKDFQELFLSVQKFLNLPRGADPSNRLPVDQYIPWFRKQLEIADPRNPGMDALIEHFASDAAKGNLLHN